MLSSWLTFSSVSFASVLALQNSSDLSGALPYLLNTTNSSTQLTDPRMDWECGGHVPPRSETHNLVESCREAVRRMAFVPGSVTQQYSWGARDNGRRYSVYMPQSVYSSDGRCVITVDFLDTEVSPTASAYASQLQIQNAAAVVINKCFPDRTETRGGRAWNFNDDGVIEVDVTPPEDVNPADRECYGRMPLFVEASCRDLLNRLPTSRMGWFGPSSDPLADFFTPYTIVSRDGRCALVVTTAGPTGLLRWEYLWSYGIELSGVCARQGKQGRYNHIGRSGSPLIVELTNPPNDISSS